jgi:hypothetical protein
MNSLGAIKQFKHEYILLILTEKTTNGRRC